MNDLEALNTAVEPAEPTDLEVAKLQEILRVRDEEIAILKEAHADLVTQLEKKDEEIFTDAVTGLYSRRFFNIEMEIRLAEVNRDKNASLTIILCDLDDFHNLNRAHTLQGGDVVLKAVGDVLREYSRGQDVPVRWAGDELAVLMSDIPIEQARARAEKICAAISGLEFDGYPDMKVTASIGVVSSDEIEERPLDKKVLFDAADAASLASKNAGRNRATSFSDLPKEA